MYITTSITRRKVLFIKRKFKYKGKTYKYNVKLKEYEGLNSGIRLECNVRINFELFKTTLILKNYSNLFYNTTTREKFLKEINELKIREIEMLAEYEIRKEVDARNQEAIELKQYNNFISNINKKLRGR